MGRILSQITALPAGGAVSDNDAKAALVELAGIVGGLGSGTAAQGLVPVGIKTSAYGAATGDLIPVDLSAGSVTVTLPTAPAEGSRVAVKVVAFTAGNTATISRGGSDVFNKAGGATSITLSTLFQAVNLQYQASTGIWFVVGDNLALAQLDGRYKTNLKSNLKTDFGAVGDGSTDDTVAVQAWVTYCVTNGIAGYAPAGTYKLTARIDFSYMPNWSVQGAGPSATTFVQWANNVPIFNLGSDTASLMHHYAIRDMAFDYHSSQSGNTSANPIQFAQQAFQGVLDNLFFKAGYYGIGVTNGIGGPWGQTWDNLSFDRQLYGGAISFAGAANAVPNNRFGRFFVDATNMVGPIFNFKGYNMVVDTIEITSANQGPQLMSIQAGANVSIGALKVEAGLWTASVQLVDILAGAHLRLDSFFLGGTTGPTLNIGAGGTLKAFKLASGASLDLVDAVVDFFTVTAGTAYLVQAPTDARAKITDWRSASGTFSLQNAGSAVTSDAVTVESHGNGHLSYDRGDADYTVALGDPTTIIFNTPLTAPRVVTLPSTANNLFNGLKYRVISIGAVNGANTITVKQSSTTLGTLSRDNQLIEFMSRRVGSGTTWFLTSLLDLSGAAGYAPQIDIFTASGTYTKPSWAKTVQVWLLGPGGAGGSGRRGAAGSVRCGGGGGSGGGKAQGSWTAADITSTVTVTIGTPATPGAAQTVDSTDGATGSGGTATTFGTYLRASNGNNGSGGTNALGTGGAAPASMFPPSAGGAASTTGGAGAGGAGAGAAGSGGGSGGGITSADAAAAGASANDSSDKPSPSAVSGGANTGGNGTDGLNRTANEPLGGCGGAGGGANLSGAAGHGGAGGNYGGGGGGGGASLNGNNSGAGGAGGPGICVVITY